MDLRVFGLEISAGQQRCTVTRTNCLGFFGVDWLKPNFMSALWTGLCCHHLCIHLWRTVIYLSLVINDCKRAGLWAFFGPRVEKSVTPGAEQTPPETWQCEKWSSGLVCTTVRPGVPSESSYLMAKHTGLCEPWRLVGVLCGFELEFIKKWMHFKK